MQQVVNRCFDKNRLVEHNFGGELSWDIGKASHGFLDTVDHRDGVGISSLFHYGEVNRFLSIDANSIDLNLLSILSASNITHENGGAVNSLERKRIDVRSGRELAIRIEVVIDVSQSHIACRQYEIAVIYGANDVHDAQLMRLEFQRIDVDHNLAVTSAKGLRDARSGHIGNLVSNVVLA